MNEPHARFLTWLATGARGEPARDLALHASVCPECTRAIAALDLLGRIDPGLAPMPSWNGVSDEPGGLLRAARFAAAAAGVMLVAVVVGIGASQLIMGARVSGEVAFGSGTPAEGLLGGAGTPAASPTPQGFSNGGDSPTASPTPEPPGTPISLPTPQATPRPTAVPTRTPRPTPTPHPTATPTPLVTPSPTPVPTDTPSPSETPAPTVPGAPANLAAAPGVTPGTIDLSWSAPNDGGSPILSYNIYRGTVSTGETFLTSTAGTSYTDTPPAPGMYFYVVTAVNAIGEGPASTEAQATTSP